MHIVRARTFCRAAGNRASINVSSKVLLRPGTPATPTGAMFLRRTGATITNSTYTIIVARGQHGNRGVIISLTATPDNDDIVTVLADGNGSSNGWPGFRERWRRFAVTTARAGCFVSEFAREFHFTYAGVPTTDRDDHSAFERNYDASLTNRVTTLTRLSTRQRQRCDGNQPGPPVDGAGDVAGIDSLLHRAGLF